MLVIPAWDNKKYISLEQILLKVGASCNGLRWWLRIVEVAPGPGAEILESINPEAFLTYFELLDLVKGNMQIIDGDIAAESMDSALYILIRAVDSTSWDIKTNIEGLYIVLKSEFPNAYEVNMPCQTGPC